MSWSFYAAGKPLAVIGKAKKELAFPMAEPEQTIRELFIKQLELALEAMPPSSAVRVNAFGSQTSGGGGDGTVNSLKIEVEPIHGFVE